MPGSGRVSSGAGACVVAAVLELAEAAAVVRAGTAAIVARVDSEALVEAVVQSPVDPAAVYTALLDVCLAPAVATRTPVVRS